LGIPIAGIFKAGAQGSDNKSFKPAAGVSVAANTSKTVTITWPAGTNSNGRLVLNLKNDEAAVQQYTIKQRRDLSAGN
jgi:hypothetical protein